ncbi:MAG TPA: hypothetical protein EYP46_03230 [Hadesarchaea archaeon]|nr:hypothetical protein [Hadesarchaea archaeon]
MRVYQDEKTSRDLIELPEDFYRSVAGHISQLISELKHGDELRRRLLLEELKSVASMTQEIHLTRVSKTMGRIDRGRPPAQLLERERYTFNEIRQSLERLQSDLVYSIIAGKISTPAPLELTNTLLTVLIDVPEKIICVDMRGYGPFTKGEIANIPTQNAEMMVRRGVAKKIAVKV